MGFRGHNVGDFTGIIVGLILKMCYAIQDEDLTGIAPK